MKEIHAVLVLFAAAAAALVTAIATHNPKPTGETMNGPKPATTTSDLDVRNRIIAMAQSQLGATDPAPYWDDAYGPGWSRKLHWCGVFALWVLRMVGLTSRKWISGRGFLYVDDSGAPAKTPWLPIVDIPSIGDIAYFDKPFQHYALVEEVAGDTVHLIAGNTPNVGRQKTTLSSKKAVFFSVAPLLPSGQVA